MVAFHLRRIGFSTAPETAVLKPLLDAGTVGVDVFFVLSGFVIAHTYAQRLAGPPPRAVRDYLIARVARIYPLHLITFLVMVVLLAVGAAQGLDVDALTAYDIEHTAFGFAGNLLMLQSLPGVPAWNGPAWSISCELAAYVVFPVFAARLLRMRWGTAAALAIAVLVVQVLLLHELKTVAYEVQVWPRIAGGFGTGALLWVVWHRVLRPGWWGDAVTVACVLASAWLFWQGHPWLVAVPLLSLMVPAVACATGPIGMLLAHPVVQWGGRISYALYLVHIPVLTVLIVWVVPVDVYLHPSTAKAALVLGGFVVASVAAAAALHHGVEEPTRRWLRRRWAAGRSPRPVGERVLGEG